MKKLLSIKNLSFRFHPDEDYLLQDVNLDLFSQQKITILGNNGSGKSTFIKILSGMYKYNSGQIIQEEPDLKIGVVFQNIEDQIIGQTVLNEIALSLENLNLTTQQMHQQAKYILQLFDLEKYQNELIENLSGGVKQRVCLAAAFITYPQILILDEADNMLDVKQKKMFWQQINVLQNKYETTIINITHDLINHLDSDLFCVFSKHNLKTYTLKQLIENDFLILKEQNIPLPDLFKLAQQLNLKNVSNYASLIEEITNEQ